MTLRAKKRLRSTGFGAQGAAGPLHAAADAHGRADVCRDTLSKTRVWPDADGAYELFDGYTYQYLLTCPGYAGRSGTIEPSHNASGALVLKIDEDAVVVTGGAARAAMTLSAAQKNETLRQLPAEWADFRGTSYDANARPAAPQAATTPSYLSICRWMPTRPRFTGRMRSAAA